MPSAASSARPWLRSLGLAIALAACASLAGASPAKVDAAASTDPDGLSVQYQEAVAHAADSYSFVPGGVVTVPFRPRPGDSDVVDGAAPVALPAGVGSAAAAPGLESPAAVTPNATANVLRREVLGFLPYWQLNSTLDYNTISTIAYFGVDLYTDGTLNKSGNGWNGWTSSTMTSVINAAHADGTRVVLTIQSFAWDAGGAAAQTAVLSSPTASLTAAQQIAGEVARRGADGVDLDFEPIAPGQSANYIAFVRTLRAQLDAVHPGYELTFCATGRPTTYDLANLLAPGAADAVFIMGYNLRGGSPAVTGSIDPLTSPSLGYDLTDAVNAFLARVPASKIILGLPWYGEAWSTGAATAGNVPPANPNTYGQPAEVPYSTAAGLAAQNPATTPCQAGWPQPCVLGKFYDPVEQTAWTAYYGNYGGPQNSWRELYFDDAQALAAKLGAIDGWNLRGVGIWALGYDNNNGDGDLTSVVAAKFGAGGPPSQPITIGGATYHPMTPTRVLDTRNGTGLSGKLVANTP
ncbi:MAG: glycosyl hydrolase family 18 protein, partial [Candidatus Limnocylindrales bacterium]